MNLRASICAGVALVNDATGALAGLLTTVITALLAAVAWLYRENRKDRSEEAAQLRKELAEWKAIALQELQKAERRQATLQEHLGEVTKEAAS